MASLPAISTVSLNAFNKNVNGLAVRELTRQTILFVKVILTN